MESGPEAFPRLKVELDSWKSYSDELYNEDRDAFKQMVEKLWQPYAQAIEKSGRGYTTEALLISILLSQQRTIDWLSRSVERLKQEKTATGNMS